MELIESWIVRRLAVGSIAWLDVSLPCTMHERLPETTEEGKRKPTDEDGKSCCVEKEGNAQVWYRPARVKATGCVGTNRYGHQGEETNRFRGCSIRRRS